MAAEQSLIGIGIDASKSAAPAAALPAALDAASRPSVSRRTMMQIHVFSALFWSALFVMHTMQVMLMNDREDWRAFRWRIGMNVLAFLLCLLIGRVIRRTLHWPWRRRLLAIGGACVPIAVAYGTIGHVVWIGILGNGMRQPPLIGIIIQSQYNLLLFLLWASFCSAILYAARLQERERSLLEAQSLAHAAELKMLRYQINPHFLFNTLNAVSALIVTGQTLAADAMIGKLAQFFRNALSREATAKVTLAEDVRVQIEYLNIELTRFPDRLGWSTAIEPGLENALVPHLILQPLFENAIKHGVAGSASPVAIRLEASRAEGQLLITLTNDARVGAAASHAGESVGLANVARRLAAFYGPQAGLTTQRQQGRFIVRLHLPLELTL